MNGIGQRLVNETNLLTDDKPHFFKQLIKDPESYVTWDDIERCMNNTALYDFELIDQYNTKVEIPTYTRPWMFGRKTQEKSFLFEKIHKAHGIVINNYGFYSQKTNDLLNVFETLYNVNAAIHIYAGLEGGKSFPIHDDYPANFIIQAEGCTRWKVFKNRISYLYRTGTMNNRVTEDDLEIAYDVVLEPGDALYIPSRMFHAAYPDSKRISMSIPCWNKLATDPAGHYNDRSTYRINHGQI